MDGIINLPLFLISTILIIMAPGPDFIYVITRAIAEGKKAGLLSAFGISSGLLVHTLFAAFGLSAIIQSSLLAYLIIKYTGAAYLVYLGIKTIITKSKPGNYMVQANNKSGVFSQGVLTNVFNPKAIITFMAFLPQFVNMNAGNPVWDFIILGTLISGTALLWFGVMGYFAGLAGGLIKRNNFIQSIVKNISGSVMILLGVRLALKKE